jgi:hypothetical protein
MRQEDVYMSNEQARQIEATKSRQSVDELWAQVAKNCPNYGSSR